MSNTKPGYSTASCCDSTVSLCGFKLALVALPYGEGPQKIMPLGLQNISAYLKKHCAGVNVRIFDYSESTVSDLQQIYELIEWRPLLVGFSVYSSNVIAAKLWADAVSARLPLSFIFCGGPHISLAAESFIRYTKGVYKLALVGEGEYSTLQLVKGFEKYLAESAKLRQGQSDSNPDTFMDFEVIPNAVWLNEHGECLTSRKYKNQLPACE
jgi:radical SAM superfamily enzyme YgiQ (UPF0313 family)